MLKNGEFHKPLLSRTPSGSILSPKKMVMRSDAKDYDEKEFSSKIKIIRSEEEAIEFLTGVKNIKICVNYVFSIDSEQKALNIPKVYEGVTIIHLAAKLGWLKILNFLADLKVDLKKESSNGSFTGLDLAIIHGQHDVADWFVERDVSIATITVAENNKNVLKFRESTIKLAAQYNERLLELML